MHRLVQQCRLDAALCFLAAALACGRGAAPRATAVQAEAGPDLAVASGTFVGLNASATTDPAGLPVTFSWSQVSGTPVTITGATAKNAGFTAPSVPSGQPPSALVFSLVANAGAITSAPSQVTVTVNPAQPANTDPVANAGFDQSVGSGAAVTLIGVGSEDPQGAPLTFAWTQSSGPAVTLTGPTTANPTFTAPAVPDGSPPVTLIFSLVVANAHASSAPASVIVTVNPPSTAGFPRPPGTPPPASLDPTPPPNGGSGSNRFEVGAGNGLYIVDPAAGEPSVQGFVVVTLGHISSGSFIPPPDTVVTMNHVRMLRDPNLNGSFFRIDPAGPQPVIGSGGRMVIVASATLNGSPIQRTLVLPCPKDIQVTSTPAIGSVITGAPSLRVTSASDITLNVGIPELSSIFPQVTLFGYDRATRTLAPSGAPIIIAAGPLDVTVPVTATAADAYLLDLRWPGQWVLDGQTGGFCGLVKRWAYTK